MSDCLAQEAPTSPVEPKTTNRKKTLAIRQGCGLPGLAEAQLKDPTAVLAGDVVTWGTAGVTGGSPAVSGGPDVTWGHPH